MPSFSAMTVEGATNARLVKIHYTGKKSDGSTDISTDLIRGMPLFQVNPEAAGATYPGVSFTRAESTDTNLKRACVIAWDVPAASKQGGWITAVAEAESVDVYCDGGTQDIAVGDSMGGVADDLVLISITTTGSPLAVGIANEAYTSATDALKSVKFWGGRDVVGA